MTRRQILSLSAMALPATNSRVDAQVRAYSSQGVKPLKRGPDSGLPWNASFTNVAQAAGLHAPVIYGDEGRVDYVLESMGCGAAFIDYDNDGWMDIVILTGQRRPPPT